VTVTRIVRTLVEDGRTLALRDRDGVLELVLGGVVLLSSAALETELAFGRLAREGIHVSCMNPRIVVGGLGFGATLRGVLDVAPPGARVVVAEKLRAVADVARNEAAHLLGSVLDDPRVTLRHDDVAEVIAGERDLAAILLDVDNGPEWASFRTNARLYEGAALAAAERALAPGGVYAVWSGYAKDEFVAKLRRAGLRPRIEPLAEKNGVVRARAYVGAKTA
jgi:spermidine synthase